MKLVRRYHWWITGFLFAIAVALYIGGFGGGAAGVVFAGFVVETIAWISIAFHPKDSAEASSK